MSRLRILRAFSHLVVCLFLALLLVNGGGVATAQSVLGSISGRVSDSTGAAIPNAQVLLHRLETNTDRTVTTGAAGEYEAVNVEAGTYDITASAPGFSSTVGTGVQLIARQQLRYDAALSVSATSSNVVVNASTAGVIDTDNAQISAALSPRDVVDLPANYRGAGSTSPLNVVQALPGVQPDTAGYPPSPSTHPVPSVRFSIQGGLPSQSETTVDGISARTRPLTTSNRTRFRLQNRSRKSG